MTRSARNSAASAFEPLLIVAAIVLASTCSEARADCPDLAASLVDETRDGVDGFFIPTLQMECVAEEIRLLRSRVGLLETRIAESDRLVLDLRAATALGTEALAGLDEALVTSTRRAVEAESALGSWWRHPLLWFGVGLLVAVAAGATVLAVTR